eukprot:3011503-Rhodomonas_salina.1
MVRHKLLGRDAHGRRVDEAVVEAAGREGAARSLVRLRLRQSLELPRKQDAVQHWGKQAEAEAESKQDKEEVGRTARKRTKKRPRQRGESSSRAGLRERGAGKHLRLLMRSTNLSRMYAFPSSTVIAAIR